jgi:hypothetical protein
MPSSARRAHRELVLRELERIGAGVHADAVGHQRPQHVLRNVLVIEGDDVDVAGERPHRVEVAVVAGGGRRELAADIPSSSARTRTWTPSSTAGAIIMRASCPPPTMPRVSATVLPSSHPSSQLAPRTVAHSRPPRRATRGVEVSAAAGVADERAVAHPSARHDARGSG